MPEFPCPEKMLRVIKACGMDEGEAYFSSSRVISIEYSGNTCKSKEFSGDSGCGLRVLKGKRIGFSHTNIPGDLKKAAKTAESLSALSPKTGFSFEPAGAKYPKLKTYDSRVSGLPPEKAFSAMEELLEGIGEYAEPTRVSVSFSEAVEKIANTNSLFSECSHTSVSAYAEAKKGKGMGFHIYSAVSFPGSFREFGQEAGKIASLMQAPSTIPTGDYTVKFSQYMLSSLLNFLLFHFDGDNKRRGISRLEKGEKRFSSSFTLAHDPLSSGDMISPFDGDGAPSMPIPLIKEGEVEGFLYDRYVASLEGVDAKGSCQRQDYSSFPSPGITNIAVAPGKGKSGEPDDFLEVFSFHGLHTSDPVSGDFGVEADIAFLHRKGKTTPVTNLLLTGNIFNLFNNILHVGKKQSITGNLVSPDIWFSGVHAIGKPGN